jgi:hypothetical protein
MRKCCLLIFPAIGTGAERHNRRRRTMKLTEPLTPDEAHAAIQDIYDDFDRVASELATFGAELEAIRSAKPIDMEALYAVQERYYQWLSELNKEETVN